MSALHSFLFCGAQHHRLSAVATLFDKLLFNHQNLLIKQELSPLSGFQPLINLFSREIQKATPNLPFYEQSFFFKILKICTSCLVNNIVRVLIGLNAIDCIRISKCVAQ